MEEEEDEEEKEEEDEEEMRWLFAASFTSFLFGALVSLQPTSLIPIIYNCATKASNLCMYVCISYIPGKNVTLPV